MVWPSAALAAFCFHPTPCSLLKHADDELYSHFCLKRSPLLILSTILKGLGLEGKLTADQIAKKWDNLRTKYKVSTQRRDVMI